MVEPKSEELARVPVAMAAWLRVDLLTTEEDGPVLAIAVWRQVGDGWVAPSRSSGCTLAVLPELRARISDAVADPDPDMVGDDLVVVSLVPARDECVELLLAFRPAADAEALTATLDLVGASPALVLRMRQLPLLEDLLRR